jgi:hypothetical protein
MHLPWPRDPSPDDLKLICYLLNGGGELPTYIPRPTGPLPTAIRGVQPELRRLVGAWQAAGRNAEKLLESDDTLARALEKVTAHLVPTLEGGLGLAWPSLQSFRSRQLQTESERWKDFAREHFLNLLLNPHRDRLGGPCLHPRCGHYFLKTNMRRRFYCDAKCRMAIGAKKATRKRADMERENKLMRGNRAAREWMKSRTALDWKKWVCRAEPDLSSKFLTRAVNRGDLQAPLRRYETQG